MTQLFLAWQDPVRRLWFPVGKLTREGVHYRFEYLRGAEAAQRDAGFGPLRPFPDLDAIYLSDALFPTFQNRIMNPARAEFKEYLGWLDIHEGQPEPLTLLARSGGHRATDSFEVFPGPEVTANGEYQTAFFLHGVRYMPEAARHRVERLNAGEQLLLVPDPQNPVQADAIMLRTAEHEGSCDRFLVGYCPRYLLEDLGHLLALRSRPIVTVRRVNPAPAPSQLRVMCQLSAQCPSGFMPLSGDHFQPLVVERQAA